MRQTYIPKPCYDCFMELMHKTYQVRAYASASGYDRIEYVLRRCAHLYNAALEEWKAAYRHKGHSLSVSLSKFDQTRGFTGVRNDDPEFWGAISVQVGRGVLTRLDKARQSFYRRVKNGETPGYPRFKPSSRWNTIEIAEPTKAMVKRHGKHWQVRIKGLPVLRLKKNIDLPASELMKNLTITKRGRRLFVQITYHYASAADFSDAVRGTAKIRTQQGVAPHDTSSTLSTIGIDMGVTDRMALSNGHTIDRRTKPNDRLKVIQERLSRCKKGSRRWRERKAILANHQHRERIRNRNECHRITTELVRRYDLIAVEDLPIVNMTKSAKGTLEKPGKNVAQKSGLNRSIQEQTWGLIRSQLAYKAEWAGCEFVEVNPRYTSQTCSVCEKTDASSRDKKDLKRFHCTHCGNEMDADTNAARVILQRALAGGNFPAVALDAA